MVPISLFSTQLQLNFLLPYNCCRYEGCTVTCTFFFLVDRLRVQWVWLAALYTHCIYLQSHSQISLVPGLPCSRTRTFIVRGACMITRLPPDPTLLMRVLGLHAQPKSRLQNMLGWCFNYSINFTQQDNAPRSDTCCLFTSQLASFPCQAFPIVPSICIHNIIIHEWNTSKKNGKGFNRP